VAQGVGPKFKLQYFKKKKKDSSTRLCKSINAINLVNFLVE
jgi:hypothetical protein